MTTIARPTARQLLEDLCRQRILILDGAMGTMIQQLHLTEADYRGSPLADHSRSLLGCNDLLSLTRPQSIEEIHLAFLQAGADVVSTNTFNANRISLTDYGLEDRAGQINLAAVACAAGDRPPRGLGRQPPALRGRLDRADQPHRLALAQRQRPGLPRRQLRRPGGRLPRTGLGADRGRRRHPPARDHLRHAQPQGLPLRRRAVFPGARRAAAGDGLGHDQRP